MFNNVLKIFQVKILKLFEDIQLQPKKLDVLIKKNTLLIVTENDTSAKAAEYNNWGG